jgi:hypothetical protein
MNELCTNCEFSSRVLFDYDFIVMTPGFHSSNCVEFNTNFQMGNLVNKMVIYSKHNIKRNYDGNMLLYVSFMLNDTISRFEFPIEPTQYQNYYIVDLGKNMLNVTNRKYTLKINIDDNNGYLSYNPYYFNDTIIYSLSLFFYDENLLSRIRTSPFRTYYFDVGNLNNHDCSWDVDRMDHDDFLEATKHIEHLVVDKIRWNENYTRLLYTINGNIKLLLNSPQEFTALELMFNEKRVFYVKINPRNIDVIKIKLE